MVVFADVASALKDRTAAAALYERLLPWTHLYSSSGLTFYGALGRSAGRLAHLLGAFEDASHHFDQALVLDRRIPCAFFAAQTEADYAGLLFDAGDVGRSRAMAQDALGAARQGGFAGVERRASEILSRQ